MLTFALGSAFSQSMIISGGSDHAVAICDKGLIYAWGNNDKKQLCLNLPGGGDAVVASPTAVNIPKGLTFSQVSAGSGGHNIALSCKKTVYCWGDNENDQCGVKNQQIVSDMPNLIEAGEAAKEHGVDENGNPGGKYLGDVRFVCATTQACMAILEDGTAVWWGANSLLGANKTSTPLYITDKNGNILQNVIHIMGGDDNMMIIVGNSPDDQVGTVYSAGGWNGRGGAAAATDEYAAPVEIAGAAPNVSSGEVLTNVRTTGIADVGAYAVDGTTGYVYGWGNNGWGCAATGGQPQANYLYATKVQSGEYEQINGDAYLTDVRQVVGGNGYGAAITEEGYLLYWGNNIPGGTGNSGGVIPSGLHKAEGNTCKTGPVFAYYCAGEKDPAKEVRVDDAVSIGRGDMCGFIVNKAGEYYVWGSSNIPGKDLMVGTMGTGNPKDQSFCLKKIDIPCDKPDICPEPFLNGPRYKCPGEVDSLDCSFHPIKGREDNYFFIWSKDGVVLNTSKADDPAADRKADKYNAGTIAAAEPGLYEVEVLYIGTNVPCDNCPEAKAKLELIDMQMPLDTIITDMNCVAEPLKPAATDILNFEASVNDNFYKGSQKAQTSWALFSTQDSKDTLEVVTPKNGAISFTVKGDKINQATEVHDNKAAADPDTTYTVWVEDVSQFKTQLFTKDLASVTAADCGGNYYGNNTQIIKLPSNANLVSFSLFAMGNQDFNDGEVIVTPIILKGGKEEAGGYKLGEEFERGTTQTFTLKKSDGIQELVVKCDIKLPANSTRGTEYILAMDIKINNAGFMNESVKTSGNSVFYGKPIEDSEGFGILATGTTANGLVSGNPGDKNPFFNVTFGKMTEYDCGRIMLTAKYGCPPCNKPEDVVEIQSTIAPVKDTVFVCKENTSTTLSVEGVKNTAKNAHFDILWADNLDALTDATSDAGALKSDLDAEASELEVAWEAANEGMVKTYYVKVRDNEKPDAAGCWIFDSIPVKFVKVPEVPEIEILPFCEGAELDFASMAAGITQIPNLTFEKLERDGKVFDGLLGVVGVPADLKALPAGEHTYVITVKDAYGCYNDVDAESSKIKVTVNAIPDKPVVKSPIEALKETGGKLPLEKEVTAGTGNSLLWATDKTLADSTRTAPVVSLDKADTLEFYVAQVSAAGCVSDTATLQVIINDAPAPKVKDDSVCVGTDPDFTTLVTPLSSEYKINWYLTEADALAKTNKQSGPDYTLSMPGSQTFYVTQTNVLTGAESNPSSFTVSAFGVNEPKKLESSRKYCKDAAAESVEDMVEISKNGFYQADKLVWKDELGKVLEGKDLVPSTNVKTSTVINYSVYQTYAISATEVCEGDPVTVKVEIPVIPALPTNTVNYVSNEAKDNGGKFVNLLDKMPTVAVPDKGNTLKWYDEKGVELSECPTPPYDPAQTKDATYTYFVSQVDLDGCESEKTEITVNVSSSPSPIPTNVNLCEDDDDKRATPLEATLGSVPNDPATYELVWYGMADPSNMTEAEKRAIETTTAPAPSQAVYDDKIAVDRKCVYTYYVAQRNTATGAVGMAQKLLVTVYQKPQILVHNPKEVCEPETVNLGSSEIWGVNSEFQNNSLYVTSYYLGTNQSSPIANPDKIEKSGTFEAQVYFNVDGKACKSDFEEISVTIDYIRGLAIEGSNTTCPNTTVQLNATYSEMSNRTDVKYTWNCALNGDGVVDAATDKFTTTTLTAGAAQREYVYTLSASSGGCKNIPAEKTHVITIGDGPVVGSVLFSEKDNTDAGSMQATAGGLTFYSCGNELTIDVSGVDHTLNDFEFFDGATSLSKGASLVIPTPDDKKDHTYRVSYTNNCPTGFDITVVSVPVYGEFSNFPVEICEGDAVKTSAAISCKESSRKLVWYKDGKAISATDERFSDKGINISSAMPTDNGVYSVEITNRGCKFEMELNNGKPMEVKPNIKFEFEKEQYIARRDSVLEIPLKFTEPADGKLQTIQWTSQGVAFDKGNPLSLPVKQDYKLGVVLQDPSYCQATGNVEVVMDGRLKLNLTSTDDLMCYGEFRQLTIDTTGTGKLHFPYLASIILIEEVEGNSKADTLSGFNVAADGKLYLNVAPKQNAKYTAVFTYRKGEGVDMQRATAKWAFQVLPPIVITPSVAPVICADGSNEMEVNVSVTPVGTQVVWDEDVDIVSGLEGNSVVIAPEYGEGRPGNTFKKVFRVRATYSVCEEKSDFAEVIYHRPLTGEIVAPEIICEGNSAKLDASSYDAEVYKWTSDNDDAYADTAYTAVIEVRPVFTSLYNLLLSRGVCNAEDEFELIVSQKPEITEIDSVSYNSRVVTVQGGADPYYYWVDKVTADSTTENLFEKIPYGNHKFIVIDAAGCSDTAKFTVRAPELTFQQVVSPNGDGINDWFTSDVLQNAFPNATITIFDRWGKKLVQMKGADSGWDGNYNGTPMPSTDYWYEVEIKELKKTYTGHFTLMRQ